MTATITRLPTSAPTFVTVRRAGKLWAVQLVTPSPSRPLRTTLARFGDKGEAEAYGRASAATIKRPFMAWEVRS